MKCFKQRNCEEITLRLAKEFWATHEGELTRKIGEITHDHISRGFFNSTGRVSKLVGVHYELIDKLVEF